jgi:acetyltransferase-like isoleucine patch superfamily enzyme
MRKFSYSWEGADFRLGVYVIEIGKIFLGKNAVIRPDTMLYTSPQSDLSIQISIEDNAMLGSGGHIYVSNHAFNDVSRPIVQQGHQDVKPVSIGKNGVVACGNPARIVKRLDNEAC